MTRKISKIIKTIRNQKVWTKKNLVNRSTPPQIVAPIEESGITRNIPSSTVTSNLPRVSVGQIYANPTIARNIEEDRDALTSFLKNHRPDEKEIIRIAKILVKHNIENKNSANENDSMIKIDPKSPIIIRIILNYINSTVRISKKSIFMYAVFISIILVVSFLVVWYTFQL